MGLISKNSLGTIKITKKVIYDTIHIAASHSYGLIAIRGKANNVFSFFTNERTDSGVEFKETPEGLEIDLFVELHYGVNVKAVVDNIMENVKYKVESLLGINVSSVNIAIESVNIEG